MEPKIDVPFGCGIKGRRRTLQRARAAIDCTVIGYLNGDLALRGYDVSVPTHCFQDVLCQYTDLHHQEVYRNVCFGEKHLTVGLKLMMC